ncbi:zinc finger protein 354A-like [Neocloeon triangulifer]|uniref:zinc finger protein 354A-like n=1 Tax=Neocloeon triangulifer TaxID=2078957 RepID=UPI00286F3F3A|nr:zinc finger protein 354A-like [Neocloeon triangulifer]
MNESYCGPLKNMISCLLCRCRMEESECVSLRTVDQSKLKNWALENTGRSLDLALNHQVCWNCVRNAKLLGTISARKSSNQDWWSKLEDPLGSPNFSHDEDESGEEDEAKQLYSTPTKCSTDCDTENQLDLKPCYVVLNKIPSDEEDEEMSSSSEEDDLEPLPVKDKENDKNYECSVCFKSYKSRSLMRRHLKRLHRDDLLKCKFCHRKNFESKRFLDAHCQFYHMEEMQTAQLKLTCNFCMKQELSPLKLKFHIASNHANTRFKCSICGEGFTTLFKLRVHNCK